PRRAGHGPSSDHGPRGAHGASHGHSPRRRHLGAHRVDRITIRGLEAFGHHGVLAHEREYGQRFVIDLDLEVDLSHAAASDDLADTIDYGGLTRDVADIVTADPVDLIEALAGRIAQRCLGD